MSSILDDVFVNNAPRAFGRDTEPQNSITDPSLYQTVGMRCLSRILLLRFKISSPKWSWPRQQSDNYIPKKHNRSKTKI